MSAFAVFRLVNTNAIGSGASARRASPSSFVTAYCCSGVSSSIVFPGNIRSSCGRGSRRGGRGVFPVGSSAATGVTVNVSSALISVRRAFGTGRACFVST